MARASAPTLENSHVASYGGSGSDHLYGNEGSDTLIAGVDAVIDWLYGGTEANQYDCFETYDALDLIMDFQPGEIAKRSGLVAPVLR